jgi:hypothetical protein
VSPGDVLSLGLDDEMPGLTVATISRAQIATRQARMKLAEVTRARRG